MCFKLVGPYCWETFPCNCSQDKCLCSKITAIIITLSSCASKWAFRRETGFFHVSIIFIYIKKSWEKWLCSTSIQVTSGKWNRSKPSVSPSLQCYIQMPSQLFALEMLHLPTPMWHLQMQISDRSAVGCCFFLLSDVALTGHFLPRLVGSKHMVW